MPKFWGIVGQIMFDFSELSIISKYGLYVIMSNSYNKSDTTYSNPVPWMQSGEYLPLFISSRSGIYLSRGD